MRRSNLGPAPLLFVVSGPSGAGKGESVRVLSQECDVERVVTYTTRPPRPGEVTGKHYHFVDQDEFWRLQDEGRFLEYNRTYGRHLYASPIELCSYTADTPPSVVELDPNGFQLVKTFSTRRIIGIFLLPPALETLVTRVVERAPESDLVERMKTADRQLAQAWQYDHLVVNDNLSALGQRLSDIVGVYTSDKEGISHLLDLLEKVGREAKE